MSYVAYASVTDDDRRQRPLLVWPSYTVCTRASNNETRIIQTRTLRTSENYMTVRYTARAKKVSK